MPLQSGFFIASSVLNAAGNYLEISNMAISTETVSVACKIPHGFSCQLFEMKDVTYNTHQGAHTVKEARPRLNHDGDPIEPLRLKGFSHPQNRTSKHPIIGGYGITENVPKDFIEEWLKQNASLPAVKAGLIFVMKNLNEVGAKAKDFATKASNLERLDPNNLPEIFRGIRTATSEDY